MTRAQSKRYDDIETDDDLDAVFGSDASAAPPRRPLDAAPVLNAVTLDTVEPEDVEWLWPGRLPYGKLWLLDGDPGLGKSFLTLEIAARVTMGLPLPGGPPNDPADVVLVSLEDGLGDTIRPRAEAMGADLSRLHAITSVTDSNGDERPPRLPDDVPLIRELVERTGARLVIIDPLTAYLDGKADTHKDADIRRALLPLGTLANELGVVVLVVRHLTKRRGGLAILAGGGSIGIIGAARGGLMLFEDPDDPERRVLAVSKNNLAKKAPSLTFTIADEGHGAVVRWLGENAHTANSLVAAGADDEDRGALAEAVEWLREYLKDGEKPKAEITKAARGTGIATRTLERAKEHLHVTHERRGFGPGSFVAWALPYSPHARTGEYGGENGAKSLPDNAPAYSPERLASMYSPPRVEAGDVVTDAEGNQTLVAAARQRLRAKRNGSTPSEAA